MKDPVLHDPEVVPRVQAGNPVGAGIESKSKIAGPPGTVRLTALKPTIGKLVPISFMVPVAPNAKIGSTGLTKIPVLGSGFAQVVAPVKLMQGGTLVTATTFPVTFEALTMPPPLISKTAADRLLIAVTAPIVKVMTAGNSLLRVASVFFITSSSELLLKSWVADFQPAELRKARWTLGEY